VGGGEHGFDRDVVGLGRVSARCSCGCTREF
jgi:hypothetical protein